MMVWRGGCGSEWHSCGLNWVGSVANMAAYHEKHEMEELGARFGANLCLTEKGAGWYHN